MAMTKAEKEKIKKAYQMPDASKITEEQWEHYRWCVRNDIKISFGGIHNEPGKWKIAIFSNGKWVDSPSIYDKDTVYHEYFRMCKYYYEKYNGKTKEERPSSK